VTSFRDKANLIWAIADLLRGRYKQADYGKVILPFTVLRRLDFVLEPTKRDVLTAYEKHRAQKPEILEPILNNVARLKFHNRSKFDFIELAKDANNSRFGVFIIPRIPGDLFGTMKRRARSQRCGLPSAIPK